MNDANYKNVFLVYICSNCRKSLKTFALSVKRHDAQSGVAQKYGENPSYGPPTPSRLIKIIGEDRDIFLKGRRCENQGLGVGAFAYYRRVVENQKSRILSNIAEVSRKVSAPAASTAALEAAMAETQFSKAISMIKDAIPQSLLISGHNPLTLLHTALSDGLHAQSDEHCLELAQSIRVVLAELSERIASALKDEAELRTAVSRLIKDGAEK
jgi:hypothetical protein